MRKHNILKLLLLPFFGMIFGMVYAFMFVHGLTATWALIGKPSDDISKIIGVVGQTNLFVSTVSGEIYSFDFSEYYYGHNSSFADQLFSSAPPVIWKKENMLTIIPEPVRRPTFNFITWPLLFKEKQLYESTHQVIEGELLTKFALSKDGNLWIWSYGVGGMAGILYYFYPPIGLLFGLLLIPIIKHWNVYPAKP